MGLLENNNASMVKLTITERNNVFTNSLVSNFCLYNDMAINNTIAIVMFLYKDKKSVILVEISEESETHTSNNERRKTSMFNFAWNFLFAMRKKKATMNKTRAMLCVDKKEDPKKTNGGSRMNRTPEHNIIFNRSSC